MQSPPPQAIENAATGIGVGPVNVELPGVVQLTWNFHNRREPEAKPTKKLGDPAGGAVGPSRSDGRAAFGVSLAVVWKHCLRNAFLPVFTYLGPAAAYALTGSFAVEKVFSIPGLGLHFVNSVLNRDQTLILGTVMVYSVFLLSLNLIVDAGYAFIDPRIDVTART